MMRSACGSNDHPDSTSFCQLFRLMGTYSLVKPPRGSNITGGEILHSLLSSEELPQSTHQEEFNRRVDALIKNESHITSSEGNDHDYFHQHSSDELVQYMAGFVAYRGQKLTKCTPCKAYLIKNENEDNLNSQFIHLKAKVALTEPAAELFMLIQIIERAVMKVTSEQPLNMNTIFDVLSEIEVSENIPIIGCSQHKEDFTQALLKFYVIIRMTFICSRVKEVESDKQNKTKNLRKLSKLI